jgi:ATP-dependent DNA helicase RecG
MAWFIDRARQVRGFPLPPNASASELLTHLNLLSHGQPTHAAVLLFGRQPQRFLDS